MAKDSNKSEWEARIRAACKAWPDSPLSLAKAAGMDHAQLYRFIAGEQSLGIATAERLCRVLGMELTGPKQRRGKRE